MATLTIKVRVRTPGPRPYAELLREAIKLLGQVSRLDEEQREIFRELRQLNRMDDPTDVDTEVA